MPAGVRPPNFHGVKGRSGRKSAAYELVKSRVIEKAWLKVDKQIDKDEDATKIALPVALKDMAQKISNPDGSSFIPAKVVVEILNGNTGNQNPDIGGVSEVT